jgi:glycosyltransferase involved in cell wall biosynthesis
MFNQLVQWLVKDKLVKMKPDLTEPMNKVLNIAVDARLLAHPNNGMGRYCANIVREFAAQQLSHRIFLYSDRPFQLRFPLPEHWKVRTGRVSSRGLSTVFAQAFFPVWALKDGIDVFWSPLHQLPILLPPHIRKVLTIHDVVWKRFPQTMRRAGPLLEALLTPLSLRLADHVIAVSQFTHSELLKLFPGIGCKIDVIYSASSLRTDGVTGTCPLTVPYFLFVGSNEPRKNIKGLLQGYLRYLKLCPNRFDLVIASSDQWGDFSVVDFVQKNDLQSYVHLIQHVDDTVLRALYACARALVMVSLYEGFGLPLVEAMQWGIPLIASNNSAVVEIAGNAALLVDPYDTDAIAQAFRVMTEDETTRLELAQKAVVRGLQFSWEKAASETMALIAPYTVLPG